MSLPPSPSENILRIRGARTHNLKNIDLEIPRNQLVVITGPSGSGKSSLAFDTLYAEGQRRYVESLSTYARQFLQLMEKPDVDMIEGLSPAIAIEQKATNHNPRSTVGTVTEIHDYLRLLFARAGVPHCPQHHLPLTAYSISEMVDHVLRWPQDSRALILAPIPQSHTDNNPQDVLHQLKAQGFVRIRIQSENTVAELIELDQLPKLNWQKKYRIQVVVDRLKIRTDQRQRLAESFETALRLSQGKVLAIDLEQNREHIFSSQYACPVCDYSLSELEPRLFSFNNPAGACEQCNGLGEEHFIDPKKVVAFPELSLAAGCIAGWDKRNPMYFQMLQSLAIFYDFDMETPWLALPEAVQQAIFYGSGQTKIAFTYLADRNKTIVKEHPFEGIIPNLQRRRDETDSTAVKEEINKLSSLQTCRTCGGSRLKEQARCVTIGDNQQQRHIHDLATMPIAELQTYFNALNLSGAKAQIAQRILFEVRSRLQFLNNVGLGYLSLNRAANTLSGGESQRIRLASQIGSGLTGVMYVLDEPSIGLHQRDNDRLIDTLKHLRDLGNTVLVVEHDEDAIVAANWVVDMGPGAGEQGGIVVASGQPGEIAQNPASLTGKYLSGKLEISVPKKRRPINPEKQITIEGACGNNLKNVNIKIPVGVLVCVTGVSGSGKSTLINDTLLASAAHVLNGANYDAATHEKITGLEFFDKVIAVDQSPIGRTPRSNPATYTGLFSAIRDLFAGVAMARERGYDSGRFSFNVKGGRCEACQGDGVVKVEMHFLPDLYVNCDICHGKRYNRETLEIRYRGLNIAEVLNLTVEQALDVFASVPTLARKLTTLLDVGLGYIRLGQSATTLSGGEAQRVKLSLELSKRDTGRTLYILDEPTTGLHFQDIALLLKVINALVEAGNSVLIIEHNLDVIKTADWIVDMGPEGGDGGGRLVAEGTPEEVAKDENSHTGRYLGRLLQAKRNKNNNKQAAV